jgi:hypothetical protein
MYRDDKLLSMQKGHLSKSEECQRMYVGRRCRGVSRRADDKEPDVFGIVYEKLDQRRNEGQW